MKFLGQGFQKLEPRTHTHRDVTEFIALPYLQMIKAEVKVQILATLPSARQHPSYGDCLEVKREYYQNCSVLDCVCVTQCSQPTAHLYEQFYRFNRLGLSHWDPYAVRCLELYYCNTVEWFWWDSSLIFDDQLVSFSVLTLLVWSSGQ